jgi:pyridoxamine 5'-phosphate oxidase
MKNSISVADLRREYTLAGLRRRDLLADAIKQFEKWFEDALQAQVLEPNASTLSTVDKNGQPSSRTVLLKGIDQRGFVFFTNYQSRKGRELLENPRVAVTVLWRELERQVCICGVASKVSREESETYFKSRPVASQYGAWASEQGAVIPNRELLEQKLVEVKTKYQEGAVPLPPHWGGFVIAPKTVEFWQGRPNRLHDRFRYTHQDDGGWLIERLAP